MGDGRERKVEAVGVAERIAPVPGCTKDVAKRRESRQNDMRATAEVAATVEVAALNVKTTRRFGSSVGNGSMADIEQGSGCTCSAPRI